MQTQLELAYELAIDSARINEEYGDESNARNLKIIASYIEEAIQIYEGDNHEDSKFF